MLLFLSEALIVLSHNISKNLPTPCSDDLPILTLKGEAAAGEVAVVEGSCGSTAIKEKKVSQQMTIYVS